MEFNHLLMCEKFIMLLCGSDIRYDVRFIQSAINSFRKKNGCCLVTVNRHDYFHDN